MGDPGDEWYTQQNPLTEEIGISLQSPKYGFAEQFSGALGVFEVCITLYMGKSNIV